MACTTTTAMYLGVSTQICASASASRSGNTVTVSGTFSLSQSGSWNSNAIYAQVSGKTSWTKVKNSGSSTTGSASFSFSFTDSNAGNPTYTAVFQVFNSSETSGIGGTASVSFSVSYPAAGTAPTGLAATDIIPDSDSFTATLSITGWGGTGSATTRYKELQVRTYNSSSLVTPRRYQKVYGNSLSSTITCTNSSTDDGGLTITPNTRYTLGMFASNGSKSTGSKRIGDYVTLANHPLISLVSKNGDEATFNYSVDSDGGFYDKTIEYSIDGGTTWTNLHTITGISGASGTISLTSLTLNSTYVLEVRVVTTAGTASTTYTFETKTLAFYGPDSNQEAQKITKLYGSVGGQAQEVVRLYGSANGATKLIHQSFGHLDYT